MGRRRLIKSVGDWRGERGFSGELIKARFVEVMRRAGLPDASY